jgi:UDP-2,4-diacetamido-2,4,6-trideoxy-beta-L-altropyranose hydrolase
MKIAFRCDASAGIGTGHLMRCLTLADELKRRGAECYFVLGAHDLQFHQRVREEGHISVVVPPLMAPADTAVNDDAARTQSGLGGGMDWLVVDHYGLDLRWEKQLRPNAARIMVIDDLAMRSHDCDLLADPTVGRVAADYVSLTPDGCTVLAGGRYALLRSEFTRLAAQPLPSPDGDQRLHLGFGGGAWHGNAWQLLLALADRFPDLSMTANAASASGMPDRVRALPPRVDVRISSVSVAGDMAGCTVAIGAPGSMTWERLCLGLPFACLTTHPTQETPVALLARNGYLIDLGPFRTPDESMLHVIATFLQDHERLAAFSQRGREAVDGRGRLRIADALCGNTP